MVRGLRLNIPTKRKDSLRDTPIACGEFKCSYSCAETYTEHAAPRRGHAEFCDLSANHEKLKTQDSRVDLRDL